MKIKSKPLFSVILVFTILAITACGGGGGGGGTSSTPAAPTQLTSQFIDSPTAGLYYSSSPSGITGITDSSGTFKFQANDTVSLYIGGASGLKIATFLPSNNSQVFVANLPNYLSISQLLLALDNSTNSSYIDLSKIQNIPASTLTALADFLETGSYDTTVLDTAKTAIQGANTSISYTKTITPTATVASLELANSASTLAALPDNFYDAYSVSNTPYYVSSIVVSGAATGERLNSFQFQYSKDNWMSISSDDTFRTLSPVTVTRPKSIVTNFQSITVTDTFANTSNTVSCPVNSTLISLTKIGSAISTSSLINQNNTNTGTCQTKSTFQSLYPMDAGFSTSSLLGKTLTVTQKCGLSNNTISIAIDSSGSYQVTGNICSIFQQGFYGINNYRNVSNPTVADGSIGNVDSFSGLVRFVPSGYNATTRAAGATTMMLGRSIDGAQYYFGLTDAGTPGELAGGLLKFVSLL